MRKIHLTLGGRPKYAALLAVFVLIIPMAIAVPMVMDAEAGSELRNKAKNVIMMIPDGASAAHYTLARWYKGSALALDEMPSGLVRTYGAESIITDSAPAATAFATGYKTSDKYIGVLPGPVTIPGVETPSVEEQYKPVASVLEAAKLKGMSVGLIATSNIQHATPAGFSAHWADRSNYNEIAEQQVYLDMDVVLGGGAQYLTPVSEGGKRTDGTDLTDVLRSRGYSYVTTKSEMMSLPSSTTKVWGMFAANSMSHDFDRNLHPEEPSLSEMTDMAIEILSKNPRGFFLVVEGSQVDWSSHANDPVGVISEMLAFDNAVEVALDFAKADRQTMIMAFTDHGNGGMTIGNKASDTTYTKMSLSSVVDPLKKANQTGYALMEILGSDISAANVKAKVLEYYGLDLTDAEVAEIVSKFDTVAGKWTIDLDYVLGPMMSTRAYIGWTTNGHTGEDVTLFSYGPRAPYGLLENTDLAHTAENALGLSLECTNQALYVEATSAFKALGMEVEIDSTDVTNKELVVKDDDGEVARLSFSTDLMECLGKVCKLSGIVVFSEKSGKVYVPQDAVKIAKHCAACGSLPRGCSMASATA